MENTRQKKVGVGWRLPVELKEQVEALCDATGQTREAVLERAIALYVRKELTNNHASSI